MPPRRKAVKRIWIQAVSVGELLALAPVLRELRQREEVEVVLTTTTSTGRRLLEERFAAETVWRGIFPLDFWPFAAAAWDHLDPDLAVLLESELWPEHLHQAARRGVPVVLANARMSDRSAARYARCGRWIRPLLRPLGTVLAVSDKDRERFAALGAAETVVTMGNLKFDFDPEPLLTIAEREAWRRELGLGGEDLLVVGASTWPGEERQLAQAVARLQAEGRGVRALLVPRHAERKAEVARELADLPLRVAFRSNGPPPADGVDVYVGDTTGELRRFIQLADIAFIGKSLPPHQGGQTPIEAAAYEKSIIFGPGMSNFRMITEDLIAAGGATVVTSSSLEDAIRQRLADPARRQREGAAAASVYGRHRGATGRLMRVLEDRLRACGRSSVLPY